VQGNISFIDDFNFFGIDKILLDKSVFGHIGPKGKLSADSFSVYEPSKTYNDHSLIYDKEQGDIWFTKGGSIIDAVKFAKILPDQELTHKDFLIV